MRIDPWNWGPEVETLADEIVRRTEYEPHLDPLVIAKRMRLAVKCGPAGTKATLLNNEIIVDGTMRVTKQRFDAIHEALHAVRRARGEPEPEKYLNAVTGAVLCPRARAVEAKRAFGAIIERWSEWFPFVSQEVLTRRYLSLHEGGVMWVWDVEPKRRRWYKGVSYGWQWRQRDPLPIEREAMELALVERVPIEPVGGVRAWPVIDPPHVRVICLSDGEVLLGHLGD